MSILENRVKIIHVYLENDSFSAQPQKDFWRKMKVN